MMKTTGNTGNVLRSVYFVSREYHRILLLFIILMAAAVRIIAFFALRDSIYFDFLLWDERFYHTRALEIIGGNYNSSSLFAWYAAVLYKIFGPDAVVLRLGNIIFGTLICLVMYYIGKRLAGPGVGLASCLAASLYSPLILYSVVPLNTTPAILFFILAVYLLILVIRRPSSLLFFLLGGVLVILSDLRPNAVILIPLIFVLVLWYGFGDRCSRRSLALSCAALCGGLLLVASPMAVKNLAVTGSMTASSAQLGMNLYLGNNLDNPDPYYRPVPFAQTSPRAQEIHFIIEASRRTGKRLTAGEASAYWVREVINQGTERPLELIKKAALKTLAAGNRFEAGDHYDIAFLAAVIPFFALPLLSFWIIAPLGFAGLLLSLKTRENRACALALLVYGATLVIFFSNMRYRTPLVVTLIPFAVLGLKKLYEDVRQCRSRRVIFFVLLWTFFLVIQFVPVRGAQDRSAYYNTHALILNSRGEADEAIAWWKVSSDMKSAFSSFADLSLAGHHITRSDYESARNYLQRIDDSSFAAASKFELIGDLSLYDGNINDAIRAYEQSLAINAGQQRPRLKLVRIFSGINKSRAAEEEEKLEYVSSFYSKS